MQTLRSLLERLATLTESHVEAAVALNAPVVAKLSKQRADLLFELQVLSNQRPAISDEDRGPIRHAIERVTRAERRFGRAVESVLLAMRPKTVGAPSVYDRAGRNAGG